MHLHANNRVVVLRHAQDHVIDNDAYRINWLRVWAMPCTSWS